MKIPGDSLFRSGNGISLLYPEMWGKARVSKILKPQNGQWNFILIISVHGTQLRILIIDHLRQCRAVYSRVYLTFLIFVFLY